MRQVFLKFNSTGMPSCLSVQWEPISSIGVAFRSSISVIAAITLITVSLQENKCNCHVCPSVQRNKCYNATKQMLQCKFCKGPSSTTLPSLKLFNLSEFAFQRFIKGGMVFIKKYDGTRNWFKIESLG